MTKQHLLTIVVAVAVSVSLVAFFLPGSHYGATVENFPDWFAAGINIGQLGPKTNQIVAVYSTSTSQNSITFGPVGSGTSTASTTINFNFPRNVSTSDRCVVSLTTAPTSSPFLMSAYITAASSGASLATTTVSFMNGNNATLTTATGTIELTCFNIGF